MNHQDKVTKALHTALCECVRLLADYEDTDGEEGKAYRTGLSALLRYEHYRQNREKRAPKKGVRF